MPTHGRDTELVEVSGQALPTGGGRSRNRHPAVHRIHMPGDHPQFLRSQEHRHARQEVANLKDAGYDRPADACFECRWRGARAQRAPQGRKAKGPSHPIAAAGSGRMPIAPRSSRWVQ